MKILEFLVQSMRNKRKKTWVKQAFSKFVIYHHIVNKK